MDGGVYERVIGRPKKADSKNRFVKVRLDEGDYGILCDIRNKCGDDFSKTIRTALRLYYHLRIKK